MNSEFFLNMSQLNVMDMRIIHWNNVSVDLPSCYQAWFTQNPKKFFLENKFACLPLFVEVKLVYSKICLCDGDARGKNSEPYSSCPLISFRATDLFLTVLSYFLIYNICNSLKPTLEIHEGSINPK